VQLGSLGVVTPTASCKDTAAASPLVPHSARTLGETCAQESGERGVLSSNLRSPEHLRKAVERLDGLLTTGPLQRMGVNLERDPADFQPTVSP